MVDKLVRRVPVLALGVVAVVLLRLASRPVEDPDTWWHMRLGEDLSERGLRWASVPHWSPFANAEWVPNCPLADIVLNQFEEWFGLPGIAWLFGAVLMATLVAAYLCCRILASELPAVLATALLVAGVSGSLTPRPQALSFVLLVLVMGAWLRTEKDGVPRWWLVPLTWVWAMCHGYWIVGVLVGLTFAAGMALHARFAGGRLLSRKSLKLLAVPVLSLVAAMLTPVGPQLALSPFRVSERNQFVEEAQRTAFDRIQPFVVLGMIAVVAVLWLVTRRNASIARIGIVVMSAGWLLITERTVAVAAILTAPLLAGALQSLLHKGSADVPPETRRGKLALTGIAGLGLCVLAFIVPKTADSAGAVPTGFDSVLRDQPSNSVVLNDYVIGGWLAWEYPQLDVVVDPLCDAYTVDYLRDYGELVGARGDWREFLANADPDLAVLVAQDPIVDALEDIGWTVKDTDAQYVLMLPPST